MEDWREKDSGTKGEAFRRRVVFNGNGGGLLMWVYALSSFFFFFLFYDYWGLRVSSMRMKTRDLFMRK